jgi:pyridoxine 4-dehydrogenase
VTPELSAARAGSLRIGDRTVHRLGLGTNRVTDTPAARALLRRAVELGVNFIDTADVYQSTASESTIGETLGGRSAEVLVATKGGLVRTPDGLGINSTPEHLRQAVEGSLRRLRMERIELYQLHRVDPEVPIESSVGVLRELQRAGQIRQIGLSNVTVDEIERARKVAPIVSVQNQYNVLEREHEAVLEYCERHSIAFLPYTPLLRGNLARATTLWALAARRGVSPHQLALRWLLRRSPVMLPIPGTLSLAHLEANLGAADLELSEEEFRELSRPTEDAPLGS